MGIPRGSRGGEEKEARRERDCEEWKPGEIEGWSGEGLAAPYLRNFKLNCDVFKLTFLPGLEPPSAVPRPRGVQREAR